eukprot:44753-Eustigmatos_ZCMA.PRE.1
MGCVFALRDAKKYEKKVAGVVLLNANFNERWKMPYPGLSMLDIAVPTLAVLGGRDERLPIGKALDDLHVKLKERHHHVSFVVNPTYDHFT